MLVFLLCGYVTKSDFIHNLIIVAIHEAWKHKIPEGR